MLGALEGLRAAAKRPGYHGFLPPRSVQIRTQNLQREIEGLYQAVFAPSVADDRADDADLATLGFDPIQAEDFDHFPPNRKQSQL